jgi:hypothetical protein
MLILNNLDPLCDTIGKLRWPFKLDSLYVQDVILVHQVPLLYY